MSELILYDREELVKRQFLIESEGGKSKLFSTLKEAVKASNSATDIISVVETFQTTKKTRLS